MYNFKRKALDIIMITEIDGIKINYIEDGKGTNVLLLHGWGANIQTMLPIYNLLKDKCRVIALDLPGFGDSDKPNKPWNSFDYSEFIKKFINKLEINDLILFGHSHGGRISIILGSQNLQSIKKIVLIDSAGLIPKRNFKYHFKVYSFKFLKKVYLAFYKVINREAELEKFYSKFGSTDYKEAKGTMRQTMVKVINDDLRPLLKKINTPTLLIWGDKDDYTPLYMGKIMENEIKGSGLVILENAGHYSYIDNYNTFKAVIESFLKDDFN